MKNIRYLLICGILVYCTAPVSGQKITITQVYSGTLKSKKVETTDSIKKEFSDLLNSIYTVQTKFKNKIGHSLPKEKDVAVTTDSVSFNILKGERYTFRCANTLEIKVLEYHCIGKIYEIDLPGLKIYWKIKDLEFAKRFADDLVYFQNMHHFALEKDIKEFEAAAAHYRALKEKPIISEEERKYIVQANAQTQLKNYKQAIELYEQAIKINPTNPMVYNNEALLFAMVGRYNAAINDMKKYLTLVPDAADARMVQDKIYEWEASIPKHNSK